MSVRHRWVEPVEPPPQPEARRWYLVWRLGSNVKAPVTAYYHRKDGWQKSMYDAEGCAGVRRYNDITHWAEIPGVDYDE